MNKVYLMLASIAASAYGSTIVNVATTVGQTYTVTVTAADTTASDMVGMLITATYANGTTLNCTWTANGTCSNTPNNGFTVSYPTGDSTSPLNGGGDWTISNTRTGTRMTSITFNGLPGNTAFDRCQTSSGAFADTATSLLGCLGSGTANSSYGYSVGDGNGGSSINANVLYSNQLHLANQVGVGDLWGRITITFTTNFNTNNTFTFRTDTDTLSPVMYADAPEPGTLAMMGAGLLFLGWKLKRHSNSTTRS